MRKRNIFLGTSGWSYNEWEGPFYKKGEKRKLKAYSQIFQTVEINSTWYRYPTKGLVMGWERYSPPNFIFTAKLPRIITHEKKLGLIDNIEDDLKLFLDLMLPLQLKKKLACLLIQLPPSYNYNPKNLEEFFKILDPRFRFAVEFRNLSWIKNETWPLLEKYKIAYVNVDEPLLPPEIHLTTDFTYFRWHGKGSKPWFDYKYTSEELEKWIPKVKKTTKKVEKIYGYFNNHYHGYAAENCLQLIERLGLLTINQKNAKARTKNKQSNLFSFIKDD
jgi:uncharacterized protein YecE (DUF72 family)